ncbi:gluconate operon transcriptional repressor GntR [Pseudoalteromonas sp. SCQQ13]|uniref:gluconate operon transcriptional repressor GntR n=1 Tax=Pseudoalteromonas sp. SCQQ13 TaxID=2792066 RepID=UPI0018CDC0F0|nr:gluconate operon transcriptional repressor GntR [Pseudoalteromonas sp. SCQQ13]MBH0091444.1 gluconate operon transcriptional repressor GntR [Pseudoalteromonas sp. SCQQ13]
MKKNKRSSLQNIADAVGVTKMTVSRYLRNPEKVSATTQIKIKAAIDSLGYIANKAPDLLSNAKSYSIGVLVPSLTNQVFSQVIRGIEDITEPAGYQTMLAHYGYSPEIEEKRVEYLLSYHVDGLILSETTHTDRTRKMIAMAGIPVVEIMDIHHTPIHQAVGFDNAKAAFEMTNALLDKGYRNIVYLGARLDMRTQLKFQGYSDAMLLRGFTPKSVMTNEASSFSLGAELLQKTRTEHPDTDCIFCTNDDLAIGAIFDCQRNNISVPQHMGVAGFHGHDIGQSMVPQLASVITPRYQIGNLAGAKLLSRISSTTDLEAPDEQICDTGYVIHLGESV